MIDEGKQQELNVQPEQNTNELKTITTIVYALQAVSFFIGITFIAAVILNYVKKEDVQGTWLASHFRWQTRTFWFGILWAIIGTIMLIVAVGYFVLIANAIWIIYRIIKGWLRLSEGKEMYPNQP
ncbi:MAG: hypothetical protein Q9M44_06660 [Ghiorsea sp.]|nr:hypothetical protein [Ghiorsea sp.]